MTTLTSNVFRIVVVRVSGAIMALLLQVVLARVLGVSEYGIFSFVISWVTIFTLFSTLGFDTSLARYLPEYYRAKEWSKFHGILKFSFGTCFIFSVIVAAVVLLIVSSVGEFESRHAFLYALPLIIIVTLASVRISALRSMKKFMEAIVPETILKPVVSLILVSGVYIFGGELDAPAAILIQIVAAVIAFVLGGYFLRKVLRGISQYEPPVYKAKCWLIASLPMLMMTGSAYIISQTDIIMLGVMKGMDHSGVYAALSKLSEVAIFLMAAVNFVIAPLISEAYQAGDKKNLSKVVLRGARLSFSLAFLAFLAFIVFGVSMLELFGGEFSVGYLPLLILAFGHLANAFAGPVGVLLSLTGSQLYAAKIMAFCSVINLRLNYLLIPSFGLLGAASSTMASTVLWNALMMFKVRRALKIDPTIIGFLNDEKS